MVEFYQLINIREDFMTKWLIAGLGNPGEKYQATRHNVGFMMVDQLAHGLQAVWQIDHTFESEIAKTGDWLLVKPQTFMNRSGTAVGKVARYFQIPAERVIVIHDDLDIGLGAIKAAVGKGPKVHHGIQSVETTLGTANFWRIRVGIENRTEADRPYFPGEKYVLLPFTAPERDVVTTLYQAVEDKVKEIVADGN